MLKTFKHMNKKVELRKGTAKEIVLKADRAMFAQMIVIAEARQLNMQEVLSRPLGPLPCSLAAPDGSLKKTAKSTLAKELQKDAPAVESLLPRSACIIDGMAIVQRLKGDQKTFKIITQMLLAMALREGGSSTRIDVVFDNYREISIKNLEREKGGATMGAIYGSIRPDYRVQKWGQFLSNTENKQRLTHLIVNEWRKECYSVKLAGKKLYATVAEEWYKIASDGSELFEVLESTQEEADTRLLLHAYHAGRNGFSTVVISSDDTDVFVLALAFKSFLPSSVYINCGTQATTRYMEITHVVQRHGSDVCRCLPGLHAFTGCDTVSAFSGKGKMTALKLTKRHARFRELFQLVGTDWDVPDELFSRL